MICPHCGADNADGSSFCSLCLGKFSTVQGQSAGPVNIQGRSPMGGDKPNPYGQAIPPQAPHEQPVPPRQPYVSPGDYRALAQEMYQSPVDSPHGAPYGGQGVIGAPGMIQAVRPPPLVIERSALGVVGLVIKHSILWFLLLFGMMMAIGSIFSSLQSSGLESNLTSWNLARFIYVGMTVLILIVAGFRTAQEAMEPGRGWLYGAACVGIIMMVWLSLLLYLLILLLYQATYIWIFDLPNLLMIIFLYIPLGAFGGWAADKKGMG